MTDNNLNQQIKGFTLIELMVVIGIIAILAAIAIPNFISYRNKSYCSMAETDANNVSSAIADYYGMANRWGLPTFGDLSLVTSNTIEITGSPNTTITVSVTDVSGRCPDDYQQAHPHWNDATDVFAKYIR